MYIVHLKLFVMVPCVFISVFADQWAPLAKPRWDHEAPVFMSCGKALNMLNGKFSASISMDSL